MGIVFLPVIFEILPKPIEQVYYGFVILAEIVARHVQAVTAKGKRKRGVPVALGTQASPPTIPVRCVAIVAFLKYPECYC